MNNIFYESYENLNNSLQTLLDNEKFDDCFNLLNNAYTLLSMEEYQNNLYNILLDTAEIASMCSRNDIIIDVLEKLLNMNLIVPEYFIDIIKDNPKHDWIIEKNTELFNKAMSHSKFTYNVFLPEGYDSNKKYPLLINLHGDGENAEFHKKYWNESLTTSKGYITVYPQSPHIARQCCYKWISNYDEKPFKMFDDFYRNILDMYNEISKEYSIDNEKIILSGFSGGATAAVDLSLTGIIPVKGVIALCPYITDKFNELSIKKAINKGIKWVFMEGVLQQEDACKMKDTVNNLGGSSIHILCEGIGHWYPNDIEAKVTESLKFIL